MAPRLPTWQRANRAKTIFQTIAFLVSVMLLGCQGHGAHETIINDFESDQDLDRIHWTCGVLFALSDKHVTSGSKSLHMKLFPSAYPGLALKLKNHDWTAYSTLCMDVYNPQAETLCMKVRIDDRENQPEYSERYNDAFQLSPGENKLCIQLQDLITSGSRRPLDRKNISRCILFMVDPEQAYDFHVDHVRLQ